MDNFRTLGSLFETLPERGDRPAILALHKEGVERWSYAELADVSRRLARGLTASGVGRGDRVALLAPNGPEWIVACLAAVGAGAVVVPLDAQLGDDELTGVLDDSDAKLIFTTTGQTERFERLDTGVEPELILLDAPECDERSWRHLLLANEVADTPPVEPDEVAALFYTSGTTGTAKGVPLSHGNLTFQLDTLLEAGLITEDDRILLPLPLHHVYPFVIGMLTPLAAGLPIILPRSLTGPQIVRALHEGDVSLIVGVPRLYEALYSGIEERARSGGRIAVSALEAGIGASGWLRSRAGLRAGRLLLRPVLRRFGPKLRVLASGGAPLDEDLALKLEGLGWRVAIGYGLTETSPLLTLNPPEGSKLGSVGRPISGVEVRIDPSAVPGGSKQKESQTNEPNREGEILARGPGVFAGYRDLPEETGEVFTDDGWFRTGDLGYFDEDGHLYVTGRASTLIVTEGGENVQPEDVEETYLESPTIREIGVLQREGRLVALIVPDPGEVRSRDGELEDAVREAVDERSKNLPSYGRVSEYTLTREPLEYTQLGKLRRHILQERYERAKKGEEEPGEAAAGPIPVEEMSGEDRTLLEDPVAKGVWDLLADRYPDQRLTPETSPQLDMGVDSLEWVNLTLEIGERVGVELDEEAIERIDTVRDLLREVTEAGEAEPQASPLERPEEALDDRQKRWLEPLPPGMAAMARGLLVLDRAIMRGMFRLRVEGLENVPETDQFVLTPNHTSYLDSFAVAAALGYGRLRRTYWGGWTGAVLSNPVNRFVSRLAQAVPVDPHRAGTSSLAFGAAVLERGNNLIWFPEGERSTTGELQPFRPGVGMLLNRFRVPVVPAYVRGTREAMPPGKALPRPGQITVVFGEPLDSQELEQRGEGEQPQERISGALRESVANLGKRLGERP